MSVTHLRIKTVQQEADENDDRRWRELWETRDGKGLPDLPRSLAIRVWALLQSGPLAPKDIGELLNCPASSVHYAVGSLRRHGQNILTHKRQYHLRESPPLRIIEGPRGLTLAPVNAKPRKNESIIEVPGAQPPDDGGYDRNERSDSNGKRQRQTTKAEAVRSSRSYKKLKKKPSAEERHSTASARLRCELATINERLAKTREQIEDVRGERDWLRRTIRKAERVTTADGGNA